MKGIMMSESKQDETLKESFPASDAPANSGTTGAGQKRNVEEIPTGTPTSDRHATETAHHSEDEPNTSPRKR
jgi:hypothetical protein